MKQIRTSIDAADVLAITGFVVLVTGVAIYALPLALIVAGAILFAAGIAGSR